MLDLIQAIPTGLIQMEYLCNFIVYYQVILNKLILYVGY